MPRFRNVCVTINGTHELPEITTENVQYYIFGKEVAPNTGTLHLQGYMELKKQMSLSAVKRVLGCNHAHIEIRRGNQDQAIDYCKKEDLSPLEFGSPKLNGVRHDRRQKYEEKREIIGFAIDEIKEYFEDSSKTLDDLIVNKPAVYSMQRIWAEKYYGILKKRENITILEEWAEEQKLNEKQLELEQHLENQDSRQITWVSDPVGNSGKSFYTKYLVSKGKTIRFTNGKSADIAHAYNGEEIVVFDLSRCIEGRFNYGICEDLKNGMLFSGKYNSRSKIYATPPRILVLANWMPDKAKFSADRWDIIDWTPEREEEEEKQSEEQRLGCFGYLMNLRNY